MKNDNARTAADCLNDALQACRIRLHEAETKALGLLMPTWPDESEDVRDELADLTTIRLWGRRSEDPTRFDSFELLALIERHIGTSDPPCPVCGAVARWTDSHGQDHCARCDSRHNHAEYC